MTGLGEGHRRPKIKESQAPPRPRSSERLGVCTVTTRMRFRSFLGTLSRSTFTDDVSMNWPDILLSEARLAISSSIEGISWTSVRISVPGDPASNSSGSSTARERTEELSRETARDGLPARSRAKRDFPAPLAPSKISTGDRSNARSAWLVTARVELLIQGV